MIEDYKTISHTGESLVVEKKSKFIGNVFKVTSVEEAEQHIASLKKKYYDARHICYAYQIGEKNEFQRASDDGEPQGTAGKPILEVLKNEKVHNVLICVTRYFGGTLLGTGGLVRAYGKAAKEGLLNAEIVEKKYVYLYSLKVPYTLVGKLQYLLSERNITIKDTLYLEDVSFEVEILVNESETFEMWLTEKLNAQVVIIKGEKAFIEVPI